jgi:hypothetical protein
MARTLLTEHLQPPDTRRSDMSQINVNPGGTSSGDGGFSAGMAVGIIVVILVVLVLIFYAGPRVINVNTNTRSLMDAAGFFL